MDLNFSLRDDPRVAELYNKTKLALAIVILKNKPHDFSVEEYIDFLNTPETTAQGLPVVSTQLGCTSAGTHEAAPSELRWKKRAIELSDEVEKLKRKLCLVEEELTKTRLSMTVKKRKTKKPTEENQHPVPSANIHTAPKTSGGASALVSSAPTRREDDNAVAMVDLDCRSFIEVTGGVATADGDKDEISTFNLLHAMSFLHEIRALHHAVSKLTSDSEAPTVPNSDRSCAVAQTMTRLLGFVTVRTERVIAAFWEGAKARVPRVGEKESPGQAEMKCDDVIFCLEKLRTIVGKVIGFPIDSLLLPLHRADVHLALGAALLALIRAIPLCGLASAAAVLAAGCGKWETIATSEELEDPREAIVQILTKLCARSKCAGNVREVVIWGAVRELEGICEGKGERGHSLGWDQEVEGMVRMENAHFLARVVEEAVDGWVKGWGGGGGKDREGKGNVNPGESVLLREDTLRRLASLLDHTVHARRRPGRPRGDMYTAYVWRVCGRIDEMRRKGGWVERGGVADLVDKNC